MLFRGEALLHRGLPEKAESLALKALDVTRRWNQDSLYSCTAFLLQRIALFRGDSKGFQEGASLLNSSSVNSAYGLSKRIADMAEGFLAVLLHHPESVPAWIQRGDFLQTLSPALPFACMIYGRLSLLTGKERELLPRSEEFLFETRRYRNLLAEIYITPDIAVAQSRPGRSSEGTHTLDRVLTLALPDGSILPFAENVDLLGPLLNRVLEKHFPPERRKISAFKEGYPQGRKKVLQKFRKDEIPSELLLREYEVARLVLEGKTNRDIGAELFLSDNTVKFHLKSIF